MGDTIAAIATAPGHGGIGVIRLSGPDALAIGLKLSGRGSLMPRYAHYGRLRDGAGDTLDEGLVIYFPGPHSFTGEDVVELQGHGGPVVLAALLERCLEIGARQANPGEFSQRAFLNDRMDLLQAEAVADLISARSLGAHRAALRSLSGAFSTAVHALEAQLSSLRVWVEAALDFPDEDLDLLADPAVAERLGTLETDLKELLARSQSGRVMNEGVRAVLLGEPNVGKSSLMNRLTQCETSIVTDRPGTTRDIVREQVLIDGIPLLLLDTAGLRDNADVIEAEGIRRAQAAAGEAELMLYVSDSRDAALATLTREELGARLGWVLPPVVLHLRNKCDLVSETLRASTDENGECLPTVVVSARTGEGLEDLKAALKATLGAQAPEGSFSARSRHLALLETVEGCLAEARFTLETFPSADLVADQLRRAHEALGEMTGEVTPDDLLGRIFSTFCIGK
ncbi:MAG: tRNA uridine-5-carboxymethylaminomethyl(34) synthesis GTPase MnmE [Pseudomonadota bacterium]|nr:tRNA uridine-5-carboxymethylaminomethyl(34) synthesis GTPase MnmE [Pseudomonadota bacterium]